ncbi:MAG: Chemotaxis regulator - transmits chemoreceptor signals to flagelllar motor component CheY [Myxococcaceae bacterium]|nr:Chemotaxis regulator - transmits chemoreceptor signals to flagelllar motor component CheY [Myxococcaceae bacterium]
MSQHHVLLVTALGALTAGLSHEIRNPLNSASLQLAVLERRLKKLEDGAQGPLLETLGLVQDELRRLDHIMDEFLGYAAPAPLAPVLVSLHPLLERVVTLLTDDAQRRGLTLQMSCEEPSIVRGDEDQLRQVFTNLCLNALDATPRGGGVVISCVTGPGQYVVHVDHDGPATPDDRRRTLEPFFSTRTSGSSLGFPINNAIITRHGGALAVDASPRGGARVSVTLPRPRPVPEVGAEAAAEQDQQRTRRIP